MSASPRAFTLRAVALGCGLLALTLSGAIVVLVIKGCPGEVARWTGRPEGRVVVYSVPSTGPRFWPKTDR
jgi:hypothetical protein